MRYGGSLPNRRWVSYYQKEGVLAIPVDCKSGRGLNQFIPKVRELLKDRIIQWEQKGMVNRTIRVMIVGIPTWGRAPSSIAWQSRTGPRWRTGLALPEAINGLPLARPLIFWIRPGCCG